MKPARQHATEFVVNTTTPGTQSDPEITRLSDGRIVVVWQSADSDTDGTLRGQILNGDGTMSGAEFVLTSLNPGYAERPVVTALADGHFVVSWLGFPAAPSPAIGDIMAQVFDGTGTSLGATFTVNSAHTGTQEEQQVIATLSDGRFVVAWQEASQVGADTSDFGLKAQIFNADGTPSGTEFQVNSTVLNNQSQASITALDGDRFAMAWWDGSTSTDGIYGGTIRAQVFGADGQHGTTDLQVSGVAAQVQGTPTICERSDGFWMVAWVQSGDTPDTLNNLDIHAQLFAPDNVKSGLEITVTNVGSHVIGNPVLTALPDGRVAVAWQDVVIGKGHAANHGIFVQVLNRDGSAATDRITVNTHSEGAYNPTVTLMADGRLLVAWDDSSATRTDTSGGAIHARIIDTGLGTAAIIGTVHAENLTGMRGDDLMRGSQGG